ncbi:MAG: nucleotidyltransferase domain-containing protein [Nitrospirae bacterium]|nr:nucleotidyltransferase domain-containing protein [Nitrospirota bacterium]
MLNKGVSKNIISTFLKLYNLNLSAIILYGSHAEDRETPYSDIDLLIIINKEFADWREKRAVEAAMRRETLLIGQISPKVMTPKELLSAIESYNPLVLNAISSGKILYDTGIFKKAKKQFKNIYRKKVIKTKEGYWEVAV